MKPSRIGRVLTLAAVAAFAIGGCGGDDEPGSSLSDSGEDGTKEATSSDNPARPENACPPDTAAILPAGFDPETCWTVPHASDPVIVGETVFALIEEPQGEESTPVLVAFDAASGKRIWASDPLPGPVTEMAAAEVDGEPGVAVLVVEDDPGDAVTEASQAWSYLAWPGDVGKRTATDAPVHVTASVESTSFGEVRWTDQGVLADDQLLRPDAAAFEQVDVDPDPILVGDYDLEESFVGVSGEALLSYVSGVAWTPGGPENGETYVGWVARTADGAQTWDAVTATPNEGENVLYFEGPVRLPVVVGDYALTIIPTDDTYSDFVLEWVDASTGEPADPRPDDLAGATPVGVSTDVISDAVGTMLSPNGRYLFLSWSTLPLVIDVEADDVAVVGSDFEITGQAIDDTTVYGSTQNGGVTIDHETATATALDAPQESLDAVSDDYGAIAFDSPDQPDTEHLVVARRTG